MKKFFVLLYLFLCGFVCCYSGNTFLVRASETIKISSVSEFLEMGESGDYELICDLDFSTINNYTSKNFSGTLNGNGYKIKNLTIYAEGESGIFLVLNKATLSNLIFENCSVNANAEYAGVIAETIENSRLENIEIYFDGNFSVYAKNSANVCGIAVDSNFINVAIIGSVFSQNEKALFCITADNCTFLNCYAISKTEENCEFIKNATKCIFSDCYYFAGNTLFQNATIVNELTFANPENWKSNPLVNFGLPYFNLATPPVCYIVPTLPTETNVKLSENFDDIKQALSELILLGYMEFEAVYLRILELEKIVFNATLALLNVQKIEVKDENTKSELESFLDIIIEAERYFNNYDSESIEFVSSLKENVEKRIDYLEEMENNEEDENIEQPENEFSGEILLQIEHEKESITKLVLQIENFCKISITEFDENVYNKILSDYETVLLNVYERDFVLLNEVMLNLAEYKKVFDAYSALLKDVITALNFNNVDNLDEINAVLDKIKLMLSNSLLTAKDKEKLITYENAVAAKILVLSKADNNGDESETKSKSDSYSLLDLSGFDESYNKGQSTDFKLLKIIIIFVILIIVSLDYKRIFKRRT